MPFLPLLPPLRLIVLVSLLLFLVHDPQDGQEPGSGDVYDVLVKLQLKAPVSDMFPAFLVVFIKVGLLFQFNASSGQAGGVEGGEPVFFFVFPLVVHHVVVVADGVDVDVGAVLDSADARPFFHPD